MCLSFQMIVDFFLVELRMTEFSEEEIRWLLNCSQINTMQLFSRIDFLYSINSPLTLILPRHVIGVLLTNGFENDHEGDHEK